MTSLKTFSYALALATALGGSVVVAESAIANPATTANATEMRDFTKLSKDGGSAFRDIELARLAIYNADPKLARDLVGKAEAALGKAKTDNTAFMKDAADLKSAPASADAKAVPASTAKAPDAKATAWLPVDAKMALAEDFVATPQKAAAIKDANEHLAKGDQKAAIEKLKLEGIGVSVVTAVLPLDSTVAGVQKASSLMADGKYYEANAALKTVEDGIRFDVVDIVGVPGTGKAASATAPAPASTPAKQ